MFLSAVWTLVLAAPIHCRGSIGVNPQVKSGRFMKLLPDYEHMDYRDVYTHCMYWPCVKALWWRNQAACQAAG